MDIQENGDTGEWRYRGMEIQGNGDTGEWRYRGMEIKEKGNTGELSRIICLLNWNTYLVAGGKILIAQEAGMSPYMFLKLWGREKSYTIKRSVFLIFYIFCINVIYI